MALLAGLKPTEIPLRTVELGLGQDAAAQTEAVFSVADVEGWYRWMMGHLQRGGRLFWQLWTLPSAQRGAGPVPALRCRRSCCWCFDGATGSERSPRWWGCRAFSAPVGGGGAFMSARCEQKNQEVKELDSPLASYKTQRCTTSPPSSSGRRRSLRPQLWGRDHQSEWWRRIESSQQGLKTTQ